MNISTSISSLFSGLKSIGGAVGTGLLAAAPAALSILPALLQKQPKQTGYYGGDMPNYGVTPFVPGGPSLSGVGLLGDMSNFGNRMYNNLMGAAPAAPGQACITPMVRPATVTLPHVVQVQHPGNGSIVTYVRAPRVKYRVSVSRAGGRRCSGGR